MKTTYKTFYSATLQDYINAVYNDDLTSLLLRGKFNKDAAMKAWSAIVTQYSKAIGSGEYDVLLAKSKQELETTLRINAASVCLTVLQIRYDDLAVSILNDYGYNLTFSAATYQKDLQVLNAKITTGFAQLTTLRQEISDAMKHDKPKLSQFTTYIASVAKYMGIAIPLTTTLLEFSGYVRLYNEAAKRAKADNKG